MLDSKDEEPAEDTPEQPFEVEPPAHYARKEDQAKSAPPAVAAAPSARSRYAHGNAKDTEDRRAQL